MNTRERIFLGILIANGIIALLYLLWGIFIFPLVEKRKRGKSERNTVSLFPDLYMGSSSRMRGRYVIRFFIMIMCPLIAILFFALHRIFFYLMYRTQRDLADVMFSKDKGDWSERDDVESKINLAPLEEAITVSDKERLRNLMINVVKGDVNKSLTAISLALNSDDSETAHYAASVLREELNDFQKNIQKMLAVIKKEKEGQVETCIHLINKMNEVLAQEVFTPMEQEYYVLIMERVVNTLYERDKPSVTSGIYEAVCLRLLEIEEYEKAEIWCERAWEMYPMKLSAYTCKLRLYFNTQNREMFFHTMEELKQSNIVIDNQTLELIRVFL